MSFEPAPYYMYTDISAIFQIYRPFFAIYRRFFRYIGDSTRFKDDPTMFNILNARKGADIRPFPSQLLFYLLSFLFLCHFHSKYR